MLQLCQRQHKQVIKTIFFLNNVLSVNTGYIFLISHRKGGCHLEFNYHQGVSAKKKKKKTACFTGKEKKSTTFEWTEDE